MREEELVRLSLSSTTTTTTIQERLGTMMEYYCFYFKFPGEFSWLEFRRFLWDLASLLLEHRVEQARRNRLEPMEMEKTKWHLWTTWQAHVVYTCIYLSILWHQSCFLAIGGLVILSQVAWIVLQWLVYIRDDAAVDHFFEFCQVWLRRFLHEGHHVLKERHAMSYMLAFSIVQPARMYYSVYQAYVRHQMRRENRRIAMETKDRFRHSSSTLERIRVHFSIKCDGPPSKEL